MALISWGDQMVQMYSSGKSAMSKTAYRLAKVFIRRKAACDRVHVQSDNEQKRLKALRESLRNTYVDLYHAMLKASQYSSKLVLSHLASPIGGYVD